MKKIEDVPLDSEKKESSHYPTRNKVVIMAKLNLNDLLSSKFNKETACNAIKHQGGGFEIQKKDENKFEFKLEPNKHYVTESEILNYFWKLLKAEYDQKLLRINTVNLSSNNTNILNDKNKTM